MHGQQLKSGPTIGMTHANRHVEALRLNLMHGGDDGRSGLATMPFGVVSCHHMNLALAALETAAAHLKLASVWYGEGK
jgi:hypothetical protein